MKRIALAAIALAIMAGPTTAHAERFQKLKPDYYKFNYKYKSWRIIESSVCNQYTGLEWKGCRRYANWYFSKKCWDYGYELRHASGNARQQIMKKREMYCHAKQYITPI